MRGFPAGFGIFFILGETQSLGLLLSTPCQLQPVPAARLVLLMQAQVAVGLRERSKEPNPSPAPSSAFPPPNHSSPSPLGICLLRLHPRAAEGVNPLCTKPDGNMFAVKELLKNSWS